MLCVMLSRTDEEKTLTPAGALLCAIPDAHSHLKTGVSDGNGRRVCVVYTVMLNYINYIDS